MKNTIFAIAAGGFIPTLAIAGEPMTTSAPQPMSEPEMSWTGFYLGVQAGVMFDPDSGDGLVFDSNLDGKYGDTVPFGSGAGAPNAFRQNFDHEFDESASLGVVLGYDHQFNNFVLGGILDYNRTNLSESQNAFSATPAFYREERSVENLGSLRLRAGYLVTDSTLLYLTGGLVYGDPEYNFLSNNPNRTSTGDNDGDIGYALGAGVETRISRNWSLTLEYLYTNFGDGDFVTNFNNGPFAIQAGSTNVRGGERDFDFHTVQAKLIYRF